MLFRTKRMVPGSRPKIIKKRWLFSYIIVLLIPLISFIVILIHTRNVITKEIVDTNILVNKAIQTSIDSRIRQSMDTATIIFFDSRFREIIKRTNDYQDIVYLQNKFIDLLANYKKVIDGIDILIYVDELDYIFTATTANSLSRLSASLSYFTDPENNEKDWRFVLTNASRNYEFVSMPWLSYNNYGQESMAFCMNSGQINYSNCYFSSIYVSMRYADLAKAFEDKKDSIILILDDTGSLIHSFGLDVPNLVLDIDSPLTGINYSMVNYQGNNYIYTLRKSETAPFIYAVMTREASFWNWYSALERVFIFIMVAALAVGLLISISLLQVNYRPVESIINALDKMEKEHAKQDSFLKESILNTALSRTMKFFSNNEIMESIGFGNKELFLVPVGVHLFNVELPVSDSQAQTPLSEPNMTMILNGQLSILAGKKFRFHITSVDGSSVFVFFIEPPKLEAFYGDIQPILSELCEIFRDQYAVLLDIVIGNEAKSLEMLFPRYQEIKTALAVGGARRKYRVIRTPLVNLSLGSGIFPSINSYIKKSYKNKNLSLTMVADAMGLTVKYISKRFKIETGKNLLNYINTVRINNAKEFLKEGSYTLSQISEMVGYANQRTFNRVFKKIEGIDPKEYRAKVN